VCIYRSALTLHLEGGSLTPEHLVAIMHSMSLLGHCPPALIDEGEGESALVELVLRYLEGPKGAEMSPMQDSQALCALARWMDVARERSRAKGSKSRVYQLTLPSPDLLSSIATKHMLTRIDRYNATDLHLCISAMARMEFLPPVQWLDAWVKAARVQLRSFGPEGVSMTFRAFAAWQIAPPKDLALDLMSICLGLARAKSLSTSQISHILRSARVLRLEIGARWPREMIISFSSLVSSASHVDIAIVISLLPYLLKAVLNQEGREEEGKASEASSWSKLDSSLRQSILSISEAAGTKFGQMNGNQLQGIARGLSGIDCPADGEWLSLHAAAISKRILEIPSEQVSQLEKAYLKMRKAKRQRRDSSLAGSGFV
jgi:hypothetical protein